MVLRAQTIHKDAVISFAVNQAVPCTRQSLAGNEPDPDQRQKHAIVDDAMGCILIPGVAPEATASLKTGVIRQLDPRQASRGLVVQYNGGSFCDLTQQPRRLTVSLVCDTSLPPGALLDHRYSELTEGESADACHYYLRIRTLAGCPVGHGGWQANLPPSAPETPPAPSPIEPPPPALPLSSVSIARVSGCPADTPRGTSECPTTGGLQLQVQGSGFSRGSLDVDVKVVVGDAICTNVQVLSTSTLTCELPAGSGSGLRVAVTVSEPGNPAGVQLAQLMDSVSYQQPSPSPPAFTAENLKARFSSFESAGVGGLDAQITELYRRVFQSRGLPAGQIEALGLAHTKGILLYGPPGCGKTLVARTIGKIMQTDKVVLVNTPDIMQKYLGESEKTLANYFKPAMDEYKEKGSHSVRTRATVSLVCSSYRAVVRPGRAVSIPPSHPDPGRRRVVLWT